MRIRVSYSEQDMAQMMGCSTRTVRRWKRQHGLRGRLWLADLRRVFPVAYESARLAAALSDSGGISSDEE